LEDLSPSNPEILVEKVSVGCREIAFILSSGTFCFEPPCLCTEQDRRRRDDGECKTARNTCELLLVADQLFYQSIGVGSVPNTVRLLVSFLYTVSQKKTTRFVFAYVFAKLFCLLIHFGRQHM